MKQMKFTAWIAICILSGFTALHSQTYLMPVSGDSVYTTCSGTLYDDGGAAMNYSDNVNGTVTLMPESPGSRMHLEFNSFDLGFGDTLHFYNGDSMDKPGMGSYTWTPESMYSTDETGALTLWFTTDDTANSTGFSATISCISDTFMADLTAGNMIISETLLYPGSNFDIYSEYSNTGDLIAKNIKIGYYFSADSIPDSTDLLLFVGMIDYIEPGSGDSLVVWNHVPYSAEPGLHYIIVNADYNEQIPEKNEDNNLFIVPVQILDPIADLYIDRADIRREYEVVPGGTVHFWAFVGNSGEQRVDTFHTGFYISADTLFDASDTYLGYHTRYNLYGGQTTSFSIASTIPDSIQVGDYFLIIFPDHKNIIPETDETNNMAVLPFEIVPERADLYITKLSFTAGFLYKNINNGFTCYLVNNGNYIIDEIYTCFYLSEDEILDSSDMQIYTDHMEDIDYDYTNYIYVNLQFDDPDSIEDGFYYLIVKADSPGLIAEENEDNNTIFAPVLVTQYVVDFELSSLTANSSTISLNTEFTVNCKYHNHYAMRVNSFYTYFYLSADTVLHIPNDSLPDPLDDIYLGNQRVYSVNPYETYSQSSTFYPYNPVAFGDYYLIAIADPGNTFEESDTTDNMKYIPVSVDEVKADIEITEAYIPFDTLRSSQSIYGSVVIRNNGNQYINYTTVGCYMSADSIYDPDDRYFKTIYIDNLYPGESYRQSASLNTPSDLAEGNWFLLMVADNQDYFNELNEANNLKYIRVTIDNYYYVTRTPELSLTGCYLDQSGVAAGDNIDFNGIVMNMGDEVSNIRIAYYLSTDSILNIEDLSHRIFENSFYTIGQGYIRPFTHNFSIPMAYDTGSYYLIVKIDDYNVVFENDETNNVFALPVEIIRPTIDLSVRSVNLNNYILFKGGSEGMTFHVDNKGSSASPAFHAAYYLSNDTSSENNEILIGESAVSSISPGSSKYISYAIQVPDTIPAGVYHLKIMADYKDIVMESNEENNTWSGIIGIIDSDVDFRTDHFIITSSVIIPGNTININYTFYNDGRTKSKDTKAGYYLSADTVFDPESDMFITYENIYSLTAGSYRNIYDYIQVPAGIDPGEYRLFLVSDYLDLTAEKSEENNISFVDIVIYPPFVDLIIEYLYIDKSTVTHGEQISIDCRIRNQGNSNASSSYVGYYLSSDSFPDADDIMLGTSYTYSLYSNDYTYLYLNANIPASLDTGTCFILLYADYLEQISELYEDNNLAVKAVTIRKADVDIMITDLSVVDDNLFSGTGTSIQITYMNNGTTGCPSFETRFYLSRDSVLNPLEDTYLGYSSVTAINAGDYYTRSPYVNVPQSFSTGTYYLFAMADVLNTVTERDESNNQYRILVNLTESFVDLYITDPTITDSVLYPGQYTYVTFYLRNRGNQQSNSGYTYLFLSDDSVYDSGDTHLTSNYCSYLYANNYRYYSTGIYIPYGSFSQECYILIVADYYNDTREKYENNNTCALPITLDENALKPDLRTGWDSYQSFEVNYVDTVRCTFHFTKIGLDTTSSVHSAFYLSSDKMIDPGDYFITEINNIIPVDDTIIKADLQFRIPNSLDPGKYFLLGIIDSRDEIEEIDENNNMHYYYITLFDATDLSAGWDTHEGYSYDPGDTIECMFYFPYSGRDSISPFYTGFYISADEKPDPTDCLLSWNETTGPFAGNTISMNVRLIMPGTLEAGVYHILGIIDLWNNIAETDEFNNIHAFQIELSEKLVSIAERTIGTTMLYPNPATTHICILNKTGYKYLKVFNSSGMLIMNRRIQEHLNILDISGLLPGSYTLLLIDNKKTERLKLIKIKE